MGLLQSGVYAVQGRSGHGKEEEAVTPTNTKLGHLWVAEPFKQSSDACLLPTFPPEHIFIQIFTMEEIKQMHKNYSTGISVTAAKTLS